MRFFLKTKIAAREGYRFGKRSSKCSWISWSDSSIESDECFKIRWEVKGREWPAVRGTRHHVVIDLLGFFVSIQLVGGRRERRKRRPARHICF